MKKRRHIAFARLVFVCFITIVVMPVFAAKPFRVGGTTYVPVGENPVTNYMVRLKLGPPQKADAQKQFSVLFGADRAGNGYRFKTEGEKWKLLRVNEEESTVLAEGRQNVLPSSEPVDVRIKNHPWLLSVILNGKVLVELNDVSCGAGVVAVDAGASSPAAEPVVQPVTPVQFSESFMRVEGKFDLDESKVWSREGGQWQLHFVGENMDTVNVDHVPDHKKPQKQRSVNPFSISGYAEKKGLMRTGSWWWDDYHAAGSVKSNGTEAVGLAFNIRDKDDFFLLRWENTTSVMKATPIEIVRVREGRTKRLDRVWVNGQRDEWYRLGVRTTGTRVQAYLDGAKIMDLHHPASIGGGVGLYVEGGDKKNQASFDDVNVATVDRLEFTDAIWLAEHAERRSGDWTLERAQRAARPVTQCPVMKSPNGRLTLGNRRWPTPIVRADVSVPEDGTEIGFTAGANAKGESPSYQIVLGNNGKKLNLSISREKAGKTKTMASCSDIPMPRDDFVGLEADFTRPNEIEVRIDGRLELRTRRKGEVSGAVEVFGHNAVGSQFRNLSVAFERSEDQARLPAEEVFREDPYMKHWSSARGRWWPKEGNKDGKSFWHVGDFYGRSDIVVPPREELLLIHAAEEISPENGYALVMKKKKEGKKAAYDLKLLREGKKVAESRLASGKMPEEGVTFHKEDRYLWLTADGEQIWSYRDPDPLTGTRVALKGVKADKLDQVKIHRYQVRDYYFEVSPKDWMSAGRWEVTNRYVCDPRWSHMAAVTRSAGALFSKLKFRGDLTMEAFMGMRMRRGRNRYPRVGDLNMAMTTQPYALDTGYRFVLGGWDRYWTDRNTYLLKDDSVLASTQKRLLPGRRRPGEKKRVFDVPWIPRRLQAIHRAWYYLKARKRDGKLGFYVDNHKVYEVEDPEPYREVYPAIWTYNAWVVVARVRISYEKKFVPGKLVDPPEKRRPGKSKDAPDVKLISATHPGFMDDFEHGTDGWKIFNAEHGGYPESVNRQDDGKCLKVTNRKTGGTFAVRRSVRDLNIDVNRVYRLSFEYRIPASSKINLYLVTADKKYFVQLNGPEFSDGRIPKLADLDIVADDQWHRASINIGARLQERFGQVKPGRIRKIVLGNLHEGFLESGLNGNRKNATYSIDNFRLSSINRADFAGKLRTEDGKIDRVLVAYDSKPHTRPRSEGALSNQNLKPGSWFCHVRARVRQKQKDTSVWAPTLHLPFEKARSQFGVMSVTPESEKPWGFGPIRFSLADGQSLLLAESDIGIKVNGESLTPATEFVTLDYAANEVVVSLARADLELADDKPVKLVVTCGKNRKGSSTYETVLNPSRAADETPPSAVELVGAPNRQDFEEGTGEWQDKKYSEIFRDTAISAGGESSLMIQSLRYGVAMQAIAVRNKYNLGKFPMVAFDYRIPDVMRIDLALRNSAGTCLIGFTERAGGHGNYKYLGGIDGVEADAEWHHLQVNLLEKVKKLKYKDGLYEAKALTFGNYKFRRSAPGAYYHLDNFRRIPLISRQMEDKMRVRAFDASGIRGYSYVWSDDREQTPDESVDKGRPMDLPKNLNEGPVYLHVRACDRAGNWGPTSHLPFLVDLKPPELVKMSPGNDAKSGASHVKFRLQDDASAVNPGAFSVEVNEHEYTLTDRGVQYQPSSGRFKWDWREAARKEKSIPDGHKIVARVKAGDFAENEMQPVEWSWIMDYGRDERPPAVATVTPESMSLHAFANFETGRDGWRPVRRDRWGASIKRVKRKKGGKCLKIAAKRNRSFMNVWAHRQRYDLKKYPLVSFEYRVYPKTHFNMAIKLNGRWHELQLTSPGTKWKKLGQMEGIKSDKKWHHVVINLLKFAKKKYPKKKKYRVSRIRLTDRKRKNKSKSHWFVDNFMISGYGDRKASFRWASRDITGIAGYAARFGESSTAELADKITHKKAGHTFKVKKSGTHWLRVKARDGAGNWGRVFTLPYVVETENKSKKNKSEKSKEKK